MADSNDSEKSLLAKADFAQRNILPIIRCCISLIDGENDDKALVLLGSLESDLIEIIKKQDAITISQDRSFINPDENLRQVQKRKA